MLEVAILKQHQPLVGLERYIHEIPLSYLIKFSASSPHFHISLLNLQRQPSGEYTKIAEIRIAVSGVYLHVTVKAYSIEMPKKFDRHDL